MPFDECKQKFNLLLVRVGQYLNPEEKNVTALSKQAGIFFGFPPYLLTTQDGDHLPSPAETGPFAECPGCNKKTLIILEICQTCEEAEKGKFKTKFLCPSCGYQEKSTLFLIQAYNKFGLEIPEGFKQSLGIKILKDPEK